MRDEPPTPSDGGAGMVIAVGMAILVLALVGGTFVLFVFDGTMATKPPAPAAPQRTTMTIEPAAPPAAKAQGEPGESSIAGPQGEANPPSTAAPTTASAPARERPGEATPSGR